ncbi:hypothetical protein BDZ85DRAFT_257200 [Elsinoe ampelina]|uniref:Uncharacterized protein n=1 Tax=Elsinoe ampelina TaxID=302913 RepID=A0A6A6GMT6_9PEZI|nr:hypothetical protein BDZ85DRAFT_257200 [Elsinoe ampelina]
MRTRFLILQLSTKMRLLVGYCVVVTQAATWMFLSHSPQLVYTMKSDPVGTMGTVFELEMDAESRTHSIKS